MGLYARSSRGITHKRARSLRACAGAAAGAARGAHCFGERTAWRRHHHAVVLRKEAACPRSEATRVEPGRACVRCVCAVCVCPRPRALRQYLFVTAPAFVLGLGSAARLGGSARRLGSVARLSSVTARLRTDSGAWRGGSAHWFPWRLGASASRRLGGAARLGGVARCAAQRRSAAAQLGAVQRFDSARLGVAR